MWMPILVGLIVGGLTGIALIVVSPRNQVSGAGRVFLGVISGLGVAWAFAQVGIPGFVPAEGLNPLGATAVISGFVTLATSYMGEAVLLWLRDDSGVEGAAEGAEGE